MRAFTVGELTRMREEDLSTLGDDSGLGFTASVSKVTAGDDPTARTAVVSSLVCGRLVDMDQREKEKVSGMASVVRAFKVKAAVNTLVVRGHRFIFDGRDYLIKYVSLHPVNNPQFMYLFVEDEGVSA
jgi:hypothetical protein